VAVARLSGRLAATSAAVTQFNEPAADR